MPPRPKKGSSLLATALPFAAFVGLSWYGLENVVQTKRDLRIATKGLESVEEMDPLERMRQRYGLGSNNQQQVSSRQRDMGSQPIPSLEEELQGTLKGIDITNFDYKPVPRPADED